MPAIPGYDLSGILNLYWEKREKAGFAAKWIYKNIYRHTYAWLH